jgi:2-polyprenyl-3-methyl-5-hydroxy-6-metoxy-1,4-benzoquinol methylase
MCKYPWQDVDVNAENNAVASLLRLVSTGKTVLEVGCATGYVSKVMKEQFNCIVTGIEIDPTAAEKAKEYCDRVLIGDVEKIDLLEELNKEKFDVVIFGDILEHLRVPEKVLTSMKRFLKDDGYIVASIPNIAHISVALELLEGKFDYKPLGLLDNSHIRFFTKESIQKLFRESGFDIVYWDRIILKPEETEFKTVLQKYPVSLLSFFEAGSEAQTYQFIVKAILSQEKPVLTLQQEAQMTVLEELRKRVATQELTIRELKKKLESVFNSRSWRITAPLRWLHKKLIVRKGPPK